jgi:hypothetical protein
LSWARHRDEPRGGPGCLRTPGLPRPWHRRDEQPCGRCHRGPRRAHPMHRRPARARAGASSKAASSRTTILAPERRPRHHGRSSFRAVITHATPGTVDGLPSANPTGASAFSPQSVEAEGSLARDPRLGRGALTAPGATVERLARAAAGTVCPRIAQFERRKTRLSPICTPALHLVYNLGIAPVFELFVPGLSAVRTRPKGDRDLS